MTIKKRAENELRRYSVWKSTMEGLTDQLEKEKDNIRELRAARASFYHKCRRVERALDTLTDHQRRILELFYINRCEDHIGILCEEMFIEPASVYRKKDDALKDYILAAFGIEV